MSVHTQEMSIKTTSFKNSSTSKLQVENKRLEKRLQVLKRMMSAEKVRRELDGGIHWQCGPLQVTSKPSPVSSNGQTSGKHPTKNLMKPIKIRMLSDENFHSANSVQCGQCEKTSASLSCVECVENYCQLCFIKMHHKGALARHHVKPIMINIKSLSPKKSTLEKPVAISPSEDKVEFHSEPNSKSLLEGTYDEAISAKSFQEALAEWRNGGSPVSSKECNTSSSKDISTGTTLEVATMTGAGIQVGVSSENYSTKTELSIEFSDSKNRPRVTYFERLMLRKLKESTTDSKSPKPVVDNQSHEAEIQPAITQYNLFYDDGDVISRDPDFKEEILYDNYCSECIAPSTVTIQEVSSPSGEKLILSEPDLLVTSTPSGGEKTCGLKHAGSEMISETNAECGNIIGEMCRSKELMTENNQSLSSYEGEFHACQLKEVDISSSVKTAWSICKQAGHNDGKQLAHFFLHGVAIPPEDEINSKETKSAPPQSLNDVPNPSQFKLGSAIWLPSTSTAQDEPDVLSKIEEDDCPEICHPKPEPKDLYYNESDSDSEEENEREAFISSRLSMVRDSIESIQRPTSSCQRDLEQEEELEKDQADKDAIEDLAWELASTVECEGRLTRCESELDQVEGQAELPECDLNTVSKNHLGEVGGEINMAKVMDEFESYQRELMEQESND